jgi:hypothetical protein
VGALSEGLKVNRHTMLTEVRTSVVIENACGL